MFFFLLQQKLDSEEMSKTVADDANTAQLSIDDAASASLPAQPSIAAAAAAAPGNDEEVVDIDLADPDVHKAAVFIQSGFKGFKQRKISQGQAKVDILSFSGAISRFSSSNTLVIDHIIQITTQANQNLKLIPGFLMQGTEMPVCYTGSVGSI